MKKFTDQQLNDALTRAPSVIQNELATGYDTADIISAFRSKYNLHIDTVGMIARLDSYMLLGLVNPQEFFQEIIAAGVADKDAREIMTEINQKIFIPLREQMRKGTVAAPQPVKTTTPPSPSGVIGPPPQSPSYFHLENKIPITRPAQGTLNTGRPISTTPPRSSLRDVLAAVTAPKPERMLEDHEEPHIEFKNLPPPNLPGTIVHPPLTPPTSIVPSPVAPAKSYSGDPYREPIE